MINVWKYKNLFGFIAVVVLFPGAVSTPGKPTLASQLPPTRTTLSGKVEDCFAKNIYPVDNIDVYAYPIGKARVIVRLLQRIDGASHQYEGSNWPEDFNRLYDQLLKEIQESQEWVFKTKTNTTGRYVMERLRPGQKYLILVIDPDVEDNISYFEYAITFKLTASSLIMNVWMGDKPRKACRK